MLKNRYKGDYADSFAAALALASKATLVSADLPSEKLLTHCSRKRAPVIVCGTSSQQPQLIRAAILSTDVVFDQI